MAVGIESVVGVWGIRRTSKGSGISRWEKILVVEEQG
jgi:hypothetical protein